MERFIIPMVNNEYFDHNNKNNIKIHKIKFSPDMKQVSTDLDVSRINSLQYSDEIKKFYKILRKNFSKDDLILFYNNIKTLNVINENLSESVLASYNFINNTISIKSDFETNSMYHELFHMTSFIDLGDVKCCGFVQVTYDSYIGRGITEGYTQLLTERYFCDSEINKSYMIETFFAKKLEKIVGREKMEPLYLKSDLLGLVEELKKYNSEEKIIIFIKNVDDLLDKKSAIGKLMYKRKISNDFKNVSKFLLETYINKLNYLNINYENIHDLLYMIFSYASDFLIVIEKENIIYSLLDVNDIVSIIKDKKKFKEDDLLVDAKIFIKKINEGRKV